MSCNLEIPKIKCKKWLNESILDSLQFIPSNVRKIIKLLAKQYLIIEVYKEPDIFSDERFIIEKSPQIIRYRRFEDVNQIKVFEWEFYDL